MANELDFFDRLHDNMVANLDLFAEPTEPTIIGNEGIAVAMLPVGAENVYMDGSRSRAYAFEFMVRNAAQSVALSTIFSMSKYFDTMNVQDLQSSNGSFELEEMRQTSVPSVYQVDEDGVTYSMTYEAILDLPAQ